MKERNISEAEAQRVIRSWQEDRSPVEVLIRFSQGLTQSHPGQVRLEPEGQVVIVHLIDKDHYLTTVVDLFAFETILLSEMENAITFEEPFSSAETFRSVTIARRNP